MTEGLTERWRLPIAISLVAVTYLGATACDWGTKSPEPSPKTTTQLKPEEWCEPEPCPEGTAPPPPVPEPSEAQPIPGPSASA